MTIALRRTTPWLILACASLLSVGCVAPVEGDDPSEDTGESRDAVTSIPCATDADCPAIDICSTNHVCTPFRGGGGPHDPNNKDPGCTINGFPC